MPSAWIVEAVDVVEDGLVGLLARLPMPSPDQLSFDGFEEGFHNRIVVAVAFTAHGGMQAMVLQQLLVFMAAILAASVTVMDAALRRSPMDEGHL